MKKQSLLFESIRSSLLRPVDASALGAFRALFGLIMAWQTYRILLTDAIWVKYIDPKFHFTYEWFPWIAPLPGNGMYYCFAAMALAAFFLALGLFYRLSAFVFFVLYTYVFLIDKVEYNNHYYLICLLGLLFCLTHADRWMSLDGMRKSSLPNAVPHWNLVIFKAQIFVVYFFGGVAKINMDWLKGEPLRHWLVESAEMNETPQLVTAFLKHEIAPYLFSYGGIVFDLAIGFLLIRKKTRLLAFGAILIFNLTNSWLFHIGIFPYLMIAAAILFAEPDTPRKWLKKFLPNLEDKKPASTQSAARLQKPALLFFSIYLALQVLLPLRHWLYEGRVGWTEEGFRFAWHMKLRSKKYCRLNFIAINPQTGKTWEMRSESHLNYRQFSKMCQRPHMIIQYARYLGKRLEDKGIKGSIIKVNSRARFNFRPWRRMIDPDANIMKEEYSTFSHAKWILPLKE